MTQRFRKKILHFLPVASCIKKCLGITKKENLTLRQTYTKILKNPIVDQRFRNHPKNKGKARKADRKVRTIAGMLVRELIRNLGERFVYQKSFALFLCVLAQKRNTKNKVYSLHEPEVVCISKGKEHKKFEFGNKAYFVITRKTGFYLERWV